MYKTAGRVSVIIAVIDKIIIHLCTCISADKKISQHHRESVGGCYNMCVSSLAVEDLLCYCLYDKKFTSGASSRKRYLI